MTEHTTRTFPRDDVSMKTHSPHASLPLFGNTGPRPAALSRDGEKRFYPPVTVNLIKRLPTIGFWH
ncbi:MAG: hypothetical protein ACTXOO_05605 [Sodalis sp. (in: enterobacteria)]